MFQNGYLVNVTMLAYTRIFNKQHIFSTQPQFRFLTS